MVIERGYVCKKCGKVYHKTKMDLPIYCTKCGEDLVSEKYGYNLTVNLFGNTVETRDTNMFGGYDYIRIVLTDNVERVKLKRKFLFLWEVFDEYKM